MKLVNDVRTAEALKEKADKADLEEKADKADLEALVIPEPVSGFTGTFDTATHTITVTNGVITAVEAL